MIYLFTTVSFLVGPIVNLIWYKSYRNFHEFPTIPEISDQNWCS